MIPLPCSVCLPPARPRSTAKPRPPQGYFQVFSSASSVAVPLRPARKRSRDGSDDEKGADVDNGHRHTDDHWGDGQAGGSEPRRRVSRVRVLCVECFALFVAQAPPKKGLAGVSMGMYAHFEGSPSGSFAWFVCSTIPGIAWLGFPCACVRALRGASPSPPPPEIVR